MTPVYIKFLTALNLKGSPILRFFLFFAIFFCGLYANAQISGTVFRDFNGNGAKDNAASFSEPGVAGITVTAYNAAGAVLGTTVSAASGVYSFTSGQIPSGTKVRVEFTGWSNGDFPSPFGAGNGTSVQFATAPNASCNFGVNYPREYVDNANPKVIIPGYVNGDNRVGASTAAAGDAVYSYNYNATAGPTIIGNMGEIGSVWGTAYQKQTDKLFYGAFAKRHVAWGALGSAGIYVTTAAKTAANSNNTGSFVDLHAVNPAFDAGTVTRNFTTGAGNKASANYDEQMFDKVGKTGIGGMAISDDGNYLYVVNLNDRKLWRVDISGGIAPNSASQIVAYPAFPVNSANSTFRPFAVKCYRGAVYVGGVQDGVNPNTSAINRTELTAYVYKVDVAAAPGSASFTQVLSSPLTYNRNANLNSGFGGNSSTPYRDPNGTDNTLSNTSWHPWTANFSDLLVNGHPMYPQPILSGIEFDAVDGSMILGIMDRTGNQTGNANLGTNTGSNTLYTGNSAGDILRAAKSVGTFVMESNGKSGAITTVGAGNKQGPGGGEYYYTDRFRQGDGSAVGASGGNLGIGDITNNSLGLDHEENSTGSLGLLPGKGEVLTSSYDAITAWWTGSIRYYTNTTGVASNGELLYTGSSVALFGKANGLGDMEIITGPAPIELGNRVWLDANANGIQDADEKGISGVTVQLIKSNAVIATAVTDVNGEYYFSSDATRTSTASAKYSVSQLTPNSNFIIRVPNISGASKQSQLTPYDLTITGAGTKKTIDNDGIAVGNNADAGVTTGVAGENDHTWDFGFVTAGSVSPGGGGGLESKSLGDAVAQRIYNKAYNNQNGPVNYNTLQVVGSSQSARPTTFGVGNPSSVSLASIMPDISSNGYIAYNSTPTDITAITNAKEVIATDFTVNQESKAVAFATKTLGTMYDHTKPICDRLKGSTLQSIQTIKVGGYDFVEYTLLDEKGLTEYATSFSVGTKAGRNNFSIQSTWLNKDYTVEDVMYNFQLWAGSPALVNSMITDVLNKLVAVAAVSSTSSISIPDAYVVAGNRAGLDLNLTINNQTTNTTGYFILQDQATEASSTVTTRQIPLSLNSNGQSTISIPMSDLYASTLSMYVNGVLKDVVYMADGTWSTGYNSATSSISSFNISNKTNRVYDSSEYPVLRDVQLKATSPDYVSVFKLIRGGGQPADLSAYKGLKFTASGGNTLRITLVKNSVVNWADQYYIQMPLDNAQKDYAIALNSLISAASKDNINADDITTIGFSVIVGSGQSTTINSSFSNISFTKADPSYIAALNSKEIQLYPNPTAGKNFNCSFYSNAAQQLTLHVTDVMGRTIATKQVSAIEGLNIVPVDIQSGSKGIHIVTLDGSGIKYNSKKVVIN